MRCLRVDRGEELRAAVAGRRGDDGGSTQRPGQGLTVRQRGRGWLRWLRWLGAGVRSERLWLSKINQFFFRIRQWTKRKGFP